MSGARGRVQSIVKGSALLLGAIGLLSSPATAVTFTATSAAQLTSHLSSAALGDTIVVVPGAPYVGTFTLTDKGAGSNYITIQSANIASLPAAGRRVVQADSVNMPKLVTPDGANGTLCIRTSGAAHHYKFIGIEITGMANNAMQTIAVQIGANDSTQTSLAQAPHHITFDRCIIRANSGTQALRRAFALHSKDTEIINCRVADCKDTGSGDSQAVAIGNAPGPILVDNCYLEAASEHILVGGSPVSIPNMVPTGITVTRNHFNKPLAWKTQGWNVKNHFELKAGNNVLVDGNIMENCWHQAGDFKGTSISIKRVAQPDQGNTWTSTDNVTISNNIIRYVGLGISLAGSTEPDGSWTNVGWPKNVTIRNNLWHDITGPEFWAGNLANFFNLGSGGPNTKFDHNTAFIKTATDSSRIAEIWAGPYTGFEFTNNIVNDGMSYNFRSSLGNGEGTFDNFMPGGMVYKKNVTADVDSFLLLPNYHGDWGLAPFNNTNLAFPVGFGTVLQNFNTPGADYSGWKVLGWNQPTNTAAYPYNNTGTDGKDIGCDIDAVNAATAGCISGVWSGGGGGGGTTTVTLKNGVNGYTGNSSMWLNGQAPTTWHGPSTYYLYGNQLSGTNFYVGRPMYKFDVSTAASGIPAGAVITSATLQLRAEFSGGSTDGNISLHRMAPVGGFTVNYSAATRNTYNGTNSWTGGANAAGDVANSNNDYLDTPDSTTTLPPENTAGNITFNVTSSVQAWVNGTANNGWIVLPAARTVYLGSSADLHGSGDFPILTVTYQSSAPSQTKTLKNGVNGYTGAQSFWANGQAAGTYHGPSTYYLYCNQLSAYNFYVGRPFYKFDLTQGANAIPSNSTIESATLKVKIEYSSGSTDAGIKLYRVKPVNNAFNVNYSAATKNTYNGTNAWTGGANAGGDVTDSNNDFIDTPVVTGTLPADGQYMTVDVTSSVQAWVNGEPNNGWLWIPNARTVYMGSTADLHGSGDYPELTVTYH